MKPPLEHSHSLPQTPAIVNERHRKIMALLHQQTSLSVSQLAHMLGVSEVTIRKDLTLLEQQQMLYRVHGSAILANPYIQERHVNDKEKLCSDQKRSHRSLCRTARGTARHDSHRFGDDDARHGARDPRGGGADGDHDVR